MTDQLTPLTAWLNSNQGVLGLVLFAATILFGWISGIFSALRRKPRFRIRTIEGPTFACTYGVGQTHENYDVHRTGIALYLNIANVGSAPASIEAIAIGYHWAIKPFGRLWWRYGLGWFWLDNQAVALADFQAEIGENIKIYPFLTQRSVLSGLSAETFLEVGRSTSGVVYFEQADSYGACFPLAIGRQVRAKIRITDSFGRRHAAKVLIPRFSLAEAQKYNPSFGLTLATLRGESGPIELPVDENGNLIPPPNEVPPARTTP